MPRRPVGVATTHGQALPTSPTAVILALTRQIMNAAVELS
jgi:hypothetical protein